MTVVPLSGSESSEKYHCKIELDSALPEPYAETCWWVKADMVASVSFSRLDLFRTDRDQSGKRKYLSNLKVSEEVFDEIKQTVRISLGLL
tara:strand:+ start:7113 stop:7382 length:270 start_codon:yes stop_codon:yes gene_type:complete